VRWCGHAAENRRFYVDAVERDFGTEVDYGMIVKTYANVESITPERRYSAPEVISVSRYVVMGDPDAERMGRISGPPDFGAHRPHNFG